MRERRDTMMAPTSSAAAAAAKKNEGLGTVRNLTEVFMLLRSNAHQSRLLYKDDNDISFRSRGEEERMALVELEEGNDSTFEEDPVWIHTADQVEFEFDRVRRKLDELKDAQRKHISRPNFGDEAFEEEEKEMEATTEQITQMLTHCQRLIRMISANHGSEKQMAKKLRENAAAALSLSLSQITDEFRGRQLKYLSDIQDRSRNLDNYLITTDPLIDGPNWAELDVSPSTELSMAQLQQFMNNDREVREREKEVMAVNTSIRELNNLFQDLSQMIVDQGSVIDRIDYNVEQSSIRISKAVEDVNKAERYQRGNKKMHCICILTVAIIFVLILIIATKF